MAGKDLTKRQACTAHCPAAACHELHDRLLLYRKDKQSINKKLMKFKKKDYTTSIQKDLRNPPSEMNPKELEESPLGEGHVNKDAARCSALALTETNSQTRTGPLR